LKTVADAQYWTTGSGELNYLLQQWRKASDGTTAQIISIAKATGENHRL
jgi:hypothetical protein